MCALHPAPLSLEHRENSNTDCRENPNSDFSLPTKHIHLASGGADDPFLLFNSSLFGAAAYIS